MTSETYLGIIPARGGSKGLPGKHLRVLAGKPLIAWTIEAAMSSPSLDRVILSSDCDDIIQVARSYQCDVPFVRSTALAQDETSSMAVVLDALERCPGYDWVVLLQPTSPLRQARDIEQAIAHCLRHNAPACVSITSAQESPYWMYSLDEQHHMYPLMDGETPTQRQTLPAVYALNGAIYIARTAWLLQHQRFIHPETVAYEMPRSRSVDIDTAFDLVLAQTICRLNEGEMA